MRLGFLDVPEEIGLRFREVLGGSLLRFLDTFWAIDQLPNSRVMAGLGTRCLDALGGIRLGFLDALEGIGLRFREVLGGSLLRFLDTFWVIDQLPNSRVMAGL